MCYALLGDIHSSKDELEKVLADILEKAPNAKLIGTGDLYECTISKKDITDHKFSQLEDVMLIPEGFTELLMFPSVSGNQEERILLITEAGDPLREKISALPETIAIGDAEIIHGHQWKWGGEPWALIDAKVKTSPVFYGHSHQSLLTVDGVQQAVDFSVPYFLEGKNILVNVGSVVKNREWLLYDAEKNSVTFMKVQQA